MSATAWLIVPALPLLWLLSGYALAHRCITASAAARRVAWAILIGLLVELLTLSIASAFAPLSPAVAWLCVWPVLLLLADRRRLRDLRNDLASLLTSRKGVATALLSFAALVLLLLPNLTQPDLVYFDGTASHDGYFWVSGAKRLQAHTYLETPAIDSHHPWANMTAAFSGWRPAWGRAGAETLLAQVASLAALDPAEAYLPATAALFFAWVAAVYLVTRAFWVERLNLPGIAALVALQPLFFFFRANGNLPNLLGSLAGAAAVVALAENLRGGVSTRRWLALFTLALHAGFFAYPEIFSFVALPCALLILRAVWLERRATAAVGAIAAGLAALLINPATSIRALHGFAHAFDVARANADWVNTFAAFHVSQYLPAFATLSVPGAKFLAIPFAVLVSIALLAAALVAVAHAKDRYAATASLAGGAVLVVYTLVTGFNYGWQKSAQFSGVFLAAVLPVAALQIAVGFGPGRFLRRQLMRLLAAIVAVVMSAAMVFHVLEAQKWSHRKGINRHWFPLRALTHSTMPEAPVVVDAATFPMAFFHGMWAAYFMPDVQLSYAPRGELNGGYLRNSVSIAAENDLPAAVLVSQAWATAFDSDSPWVFSGGGITLLTRPTSVTRLSGFQPANGVPLLAENRLQLELRPQTDSSLRLALAPLDPAALTAPVRWRVNRDAPSVPTFHAESDGAGPWNFVVPLVAGASNRVELTTATESPAAFRVTALRLIPSR